MLSVQGSWRRLHDLNFHGSDFFEDTQPRGRKLPAVILDYTTCDLDGAENECLPL